MFNWESVKKTGVVLMKTWVASDCPLCRFYFPSFNFVDRLYPVGGLKGRKVKPDS
jgi:thiol-disulfide isomerase/thioredoxin